MLTPKEIRELSEGEGRAVEHMDECVLYELRNHWIPGTTLTVAVECFPLKIRKEVMRRLQAAGWMVHDFKVDGDTCWDISEEREGYQE